MSKPITVDDPRHGTYNGYINCGCRCVKCRKANTSYMKQRRKERWYITRKYGLPEYVDHGKPGTYGNWGCLCELCKKARK